MRPSRTSASAMALLALAMGCGVRAVAGPQAPGQGAQAGSGGPASSGGASQGQNIEVWRVPVTGAEQAERAGQFVRAGRLFEQAARLAATGLAGPGQGRQVLASLWRRAAWAYERAGWLYDTLRCLDRLAAAMDSHALRVALAHRMARLLARLRFERQRALWRTIEAPAQSLLAGLLGPGLARAWAGRGRRDLATRILKRVGNAARRAQSLLQEGRLALPGRVGFLAVLSGRYARWSLSALRGVLLAAEEASAGSAVGGWQVRVVPLAQGTDAAMETLRYVERVPLVIGPVGRKAREAAAQAARLGLPLLALSSAFGVAARGRGVFSYLPGAEGRFVTLVEAARQQARCLFTRRGRCHARPRRRRRHRRGHRRRRCKRIRLLNLPDRVALVVPESGVGPRLAQASRGLAGWAADQPAVFRYRLGQTTFTDLVRGLKRGRFGVVVAAMGWGTLSMFVSQLAAAGLWSSTGRRRILLAALGDGLSPSRMVRSARYLEGALLAPAFVPDPQDGRWGAFVAAFQARYGFLPDTLAAYAHEATLVAIRALRAGLEGVAVRLGATTIRGRPVFDAQGRYAREPELFRVVRGRLVPWTGPSCGGSR